jgi:hypothetical protein
VSAARPDGLACWRRERRHRRAQRLAGMEVLRQRLGIAAALLGDPPVLNRHRRPQRGHIGIRDRQWLAVLTRASNDVDR